VADPFKGFTISKDSLTGIPVDFFRELMPGIDKTDLLKLCLYVLWKANTVGDYRICFSAREMLQDNIFSDGLSKKSNDTAGLISELLEQAVNDNILLRWQKDDKTEARYFINCEAGQSALDQADEDIRSSHITLDQVQPNIFKVYEQNIGPLTPLIADTLRDAQETYPQEWIREAIEIAIQNNVRRWRYVQSILDRWQKEGKNGTDRRRDKTDYRSYLDD